MCQHRQLAGGSSGITAIIGPQAFSSTACRMAVFASSGRGVLPRLCLLISPCLPLPTTHQVVDDDVRLSEKTPVLPELLQQSGWATGALSPRLRSGLWFERGFDAFEDLTFTLKNLRRDVKAPMVVDDALRWWSKQQAASRCLPILRCPLQFPPAPYFSF